MCELRESHSFKPLPTDSPSSTRPSGIPLEYLGNGECRFPVSQTKDGEHLFCGQPIERGSYCTCHRCLAGQPVSPSKARGILRAVRSDAPSNISSSKLCSYFPDLAKPGAVEEQFDLFGIAASGCNAVPACPSNQ